MPPLLPDHLKRLRTKRERGLVVLEALTVGLPFCAFKAIAGAALWAGGPALRGAAGILLTLSVLDILINGLNVVAVLARGRRWLPVCTLQAVALRVRTSHRSAELGTALDLMLSFGLVAGMLGLGGLAHLPADHLQIWNLSVILNVLGAGALRFAHAVALPDPRPDP